MVKIPVDVMRAGAEAGSSSFEPLDAGVYTCTVREIEVKESKTGEFPYLAMVLEIPDGFENKGRRFWTNVSYSPKAAFKMKEFQEAFALDATQEFDTDELIGTPVMASVGVETAQQGKNAGKLQNVVNGLLPYEDDGDGENEGDF